ncbi:MAG TPA: hypothetical protein VNZ47_10900 [Candidatus Dormibacteraeota bacterium]|jgi:hypothetical protein|nr:hypothetical protein [Candidatus Dormibacteraeota bacterium]
MSSAAKTYAKEVHSQLQRYANWLPNDKIKVGDVGQLHDNIFYKLTDLNKFGIPFKVVNDPTTNATYKFTSSGSTEVASSPTASGTFPSGVQATATLTIGLAKQHSVYFLLAKCNGSAIEDQLALGSDILKRVKSKQWQMDYVVVTRLVTAGSATILQASSNNASVVLEGSGKTPVLDMLNTGASVGVKSQTSVGFSVVTANKLTPLLSLGKVDLSILDWFFGGDPKFQAFTTVKNAKLGVGRLRSLVKANPDIDFASTSGSKVGMEELRVKLPKYGDYVDIANLFDFAAQSKSITHTVAKSAVAKAVKSSRGRMEVPLASFDQFNPRVGSKRVTSLVNKIDEIEFEPKSGGNFVLLNVKLPKLGDAVDIDPLLTLTREAAKPRPSARMTAELSFHEID